MADHLAVIHPGVDRGAGRNVRFVFLTFLDGDVVPVEVFKRGKALRALPHQITVRHGVTDDCNSPAQGLQDPGHAPRRLGLTCPVRTAPMLTTGTRATSVVAPGPSSTKLAPAAMAMEPTCMTCSWETSL